mmetsp:Transcript_61359/g.154932  ORF Transcript_61359/g.154932 Transcript_61359/m.154932 type:complete len:275 (+) Transcript_61359:319-1143(+)
MTKTQTNKVGSKWKSGMKMQYPAYKVGKMAVLHTISTSAEILLTSSNDNHPFAIIIASTTTVRKSQPLLSMQRPTKLPQTGRGSTTHRLTTMTEEKSIKLWNCSTVLACHKFNSLNLLSMSTFPKAERTAWATAHNVPQVAAPTLCEPIKALPKPYFNAANVTNPSTAHCVFVCCRPLTNRDKSATIMRRVFETATYKGPPPLLTDSSPATSARLLANDAGNIDKCRSPLRNCSESPLKSHMNAMTTTPRRVLNRAKPISNSSGSYGKARVISS